MSKKQKKGRIERLRKFSGAARETLEEKVAELEVEVREQKKTLIIGGVIFLFGLAIGVALASDKKEK